EATTEAYEGEWEGVEDAATETEEASMAQPMPTATRAPVWGGATDYVRGVAPEEAPTPAEETAMAKKTPGFGALFAISCLVAVAYRVRWR
ncbi:MAG: hypothetical protein KAR25_06030, partial [Methanosarcinales archaeon]|nr:hypothetical protein [Methanosarcinales archaeon]